MPHEKSQQDQGMDNHPPKAGRNFLGTAETAEIPIVEGALAGTDYTARDASTRNDSATQHADTGKIRGICSPGVPGAHRPLTPLETSQLVSRITNEGEFAIAAEVDARLSSALFDAGRSALGMPGSVDTLKAMLRKAGLTLVLA